MTTCQKTNGDILRRHADHLGIPRRTLAQVQAALAQAEKTDSHVRFANLMVRHGRLEADALEYARQIAGGASREA